MSGRIPAGYRSPTHGRMRAWWCLNRRAVWHMVLACVASCFGWWLFQWGDQERAAALAGDPQVLAARHAIRAALHWGDAVPVLEHALSGTGMAVAGVTVLQLYYTVCQPPRPDEPGLSRRSRILLPVCIGAAVAALAWWLRYGYTGWLVIPVDLSAIGWAFARPGRLRRLALDAPGTFIALAGGLPWLNFELAWKLYRWPASHEALTVIVTQLLASSVALVACSFLAGAVIRRCAALRPAGA